MGFRLDEGETMATHAVRRWPSLLNVEEAAELAGLNPETVRVLIRNGELRARLMGRTYVLARADLLMDIARHRQRVVEDYRTRGEQRKARGR